VAAPECMVVGCGSSAYAVRDITKDQPEQGWARLPGDVLLCNLHAEELKDPETEWMLVRDERKLYVGDSLRNLNEYILLGVETIMGYGTAREFSHNAEDGNHLTLRVRRRGDKEKDMTLVITSTEIADQLNNWVGYLPGTH
jgi:hypothetical protein